MNFSICAPVSENVGKHNTKVKAYPDGSTMITYCSRPIFREKNLESCRDLYDDVIEECWIKEAPKEESGEDRPVFESREGESRGADSSACERKSEWLRVVRNRVKDMAIINDFKYFATFTINPEKIDSYDTKAVIKKVSNWLNNQVNRKGLKYILVPEYHKSGRIHCHALINDVFKLVDSSHRSKQKIIYNILDWRYGFSTAIELDKNIYRVANYVSKYISKGTKKIFGKYYWHSKNIRREPDTYLIDSDYESINLKEYFPIEGCKWISFKYESSFAVHDDVESDTRDLDKASELATEHYECKSSRTDKPVPMLSSLRRFFNKPIKERFTHEKISIFSRLLPSSARWRPRTFCALQPGGQLYYRLV